MHKLNHHLLISFLHSVGYLHWRAQSGCSIFPCYSSHPCWFVMHYIVISALFLCTVQTDGTALHKLWLSPNSCWIHITGPLRCVFLMPIWYRAEVAQPDKWIQIFPSVIKWRHHISPMTAVLGCLYLGVNRQCFHRSVRTCLCHMYYPWTFL